MPDLTTAEICRIAAEERVPITEECFEYVFSLGLIPPTITGSEARARAYFQSPKGQVRHYLHVSEKVHARITGTTLYLDCGENGKLTCSLGELEAAFKGLGLIMDLGEE